ncbi:gliding motility-associated-like protein [Flavobacterium sp. 28A]|uniref:T9SS type B sorting domain-containing protein n=1 Tax=Flavobacterium sp. 28A TaxID=2735895 RepID=UPI00156F2C63|nr:T9SS type B sorting domain-containing protein [Flavobacterium sp. 28A]NRT14507.1 gliding motility-associated-like protein [Flavobacterium sp. 28A]
MNNSDLNTMKKVTFLKSILFVFIFLQSLLSVAQKQVDFSARYDKDINGDIILIGNNILNRQSIATPSDDPNTANNDLEKLNSDNDYLMNYVNISPEAGVYNSSSATLTLPDPLCSRIVYAGLYWSAVTRGDESITDVKFKMPTGGYNNVKGTVIHDTGTGLIGSSKPYTSYADVTTLIKSLATTSASGTYTVANVSTAQGTNNSPTLKTGLSAGWSLFIVYENVYYPRKSITSFDGFWVINEDNNVTIPVSGFRTIPKGPVKAKFAFSAIEGDRGIGGDYLSINNVKMTPPERPDEYFTEYDIKQRYVWRNGRWVLEDYYVAKQVLKNNFFNSTVTSMGSVVSARNPSSTNTLGFDAGVFEIDNPINDTKNAPGGSVLDNNKTSANIFLGSDGDLYYFYFTAFAVEIIAPDIVLTKAVLDKDDKPAGGADVRPGDDLKYTISFQNKGNDDAKNFTITDQLPANVKFDITKDILLPLPKGVTHNYDAATRTIVFTVNKDLVKAKGGLYTIKFRVKVANCDELTEPCSNIIKNIAYSKYNGVINTDSFGDGSFDSTTGCDRSPSTTNFLVGLDKCVFKETVSLCGTSIDIKGPNGFPVYTWKDPTGATVGGNNQTITATKLGTYVVVASGANPCVDITKTFEVIDPLSSKESNPINEYADNIDSTTKLPYICVNNGKPFPKIFLCGKNDTRDLTIKLTAFKSIVWQETKTVSPTLPDSCPNETAAATWTTVKNGNTFTADRPGFFKVIINFTDVCFSTYYFNVYQNPLDPKATVRNITCDTKGRITVTNPSIGSGYEYSLDGITYGSSNVFDNLAAGDYTVSIKQTVPVTTANSKLCDFKVTASVLNQIFTTTVLTTNPLCAGEKGSIKVTANDVNKQYQFIVYKQGTTNIVGDTGLIDDNFKNFEGIDPGKYDVVTKTSDGCYKKESVEIFAKELKATASLTKNLTCGSGEITVVASGGTPVVGTPPYYYYFINGSTTAVTNPIIPVPTAGPYNIVVVDASGCRVTLPTINVVEVAKPTYTVTKTDIKCYGDKSGEIKFNITKANGYTLAYSIDNGVTFTTNGTFSNLAAGTYIPVIKYSLGGQVCTETATIITITEPATALTASGGVAELAGCGTANTGKLRFTNPQGGTTPYEYSFDGGASFQNLPEKYVAPGTYTLVIRDKGGCTFTIPAVILDPKPADPIIDENVNTTYNCDGSATATVKVTTPTSTTGTTYTYEYYLKTGSGTPVANTPIDNNIFTNVPSGTHTVIVKYNVQTVSSYSNLLQEDFGKGGFTTTPGINPAYCFEDESTTHLAPGYKCNKDKWINDGEYAVASAIETVFGSWIVAKDHTLPKDPKGRFLCVNVGGSAGIGGILYSKPITDVLPNQPVIISLWAENLIRASKSTLNDPKLTIQLVNNLNGIGGSETIVATTDTTNPWVVPKSEKWEYKQLELNPGTYKNLSFVIRSYSDEFNGNDVLIDDIWVRQIPKSCGNERSFPIIIDSSKAFNSTQPTVQNALCNGGDGSIQINAQNFDPINGFYYSTDNGVTFINATTSPVKVTLPAGDYKVIVKNDVAGTCQFPFNAKVTAPTAVTVTATVTTKPTCTNGATITAVASNGTPGYEYELRKPDGTVVVAFKTSAVFNNVASGSYVVVARDINKCTSSASATVVIDTPTPPVATLDSASDLCYDSVNKAKLVVSVTGGTGTLSYSLDGAPGQNTNTFTNVIPGTHNIVVTDSNNCTATIAGIIIAKELNATPTVSKTLDCSATTPNATIDVVITEGTAPYTYIVKKDSGSYGTSVNVTANAFSYSASAAGVYTFSIKDATGCEKIISATINSIVNPTVDATPTQVTCFGLANGEVVLLGKGGSGGYTYSFNGSPFRTTSIYKNLSAGTAYPFEVKDSKGCVGLGTITLTQPTQLVATATPTTFTCSATNVKQTATVTIAVPTTGTTPYTYSFDNGATPYLAGNTKTYTDNGTDQVIQYAVQDKNGCIATGTLTLKALNTPTDLTFAAAAVTCDATTTTVTATATNGVGALTYEITAPTAAIATNTTGVFAGLTPNTYNFKVTDANGCFYTESYEIKAVTPIAVIGNKVSDVKCNGDANGEINFTVSGNATVGAYTYTITPATGVAVKTNNTINVKGLIAGSYKIDVKDDATGCIATTTVVIAQPAALTLTAVGTNVNCNNFLSQITATAGGGTANYEYAAVKTTTTAPTTYGTNPVIVDTNSGADLVWDVYTKDANGCTTFRTITIVLDATPTVTAVVSNQCTATGTNFTITATAGTTGVTPFTYSIDGTNFKTGNTFNVAPGTYTVTIKDKNGCTNTAAPITVYPKLTTAATTKQLDCSTTPDGSITVTIAGGKANYSYTVKKGTATASAPITGVTGPTFTYPVLVANAGSYTFVITDANGCKSTVTATIDARTNPTLAIASQTDVTCNGLATGSVTLIGSGGSGTGYTYSNDGTTYGVNATFTGLAAGSYTFYVKDSKECTESFVVTIVEPNSLAVTANVTGFTCSTTNVKQIATVTLTANAGTGTSPYTYSFDNGLNYLPGNTQTYTDTGADQTVNYAIKDKNGCIVTGSLVLKALNPPTDLTFAAAAVTCTATTTTVTATATVASGTLKTPLTYQITSPTASATNTDGIFAGLAPNTYNFKVTDANGCFYTESFEVKPATPITLSGNKLTDVKCFGDSTGSANYTVGGFATTYSYTVNAGTAITGKSAKTINLTALAAGNYAVVVTDEATGCTATATVTINQPASGLTASIISNSNANCNVATSTVTVSASGGTATYTYAFVQNNVVPVAANYSTVKTANLDPATNTEWDVWAKDANGCTFRVDVTIAFDPVPTVSASATSQCLGSGTYTITALNTTTPATGIVSPITYSINNGTYQSGNTFTVTAAGDYIIRMKDGNGCIAISNTITVNPILTLSAKLDKNITCTLPADAKITLTTNGGNGTYTYTATPNTGTFVANVFTTSTPGSYTFTVTDTSASGCTATTTTAIVIVAAVNPLITGTTPTQTIKCNGDTTGAFSVQIDATKGQAPFTYSIDGGTTFQTSNTFTGLAAGTYTVTLKDGKGCLDTRNITIAEPTKIVIDFEKENIKCNPGSPTISQGSITINGVTGGTANYNYYVTGINNYYKEELNTPGASVVFDIVDFGLYQIRVTDANGCQVTIDNVLIASAPDDLVINIINSANCVSGGTADVSIGTSLASAGPFSFNIYRGPGQFFTTNGSDGWQAESAVGSKATTFTGLLPGVTYTFVVYDSNTKCYYFETAAGPIPTNTSLTLTNVVENNIKCFSDTYGSVNFDVRNGYTTPAPGSPVTVTYQVYEAFTNKLIAGAGITVPVTIAPGATLNVTDLGASELTVGTYYVLVKEVTGPNAGCSAVSAEFNIKKSPSQLLLTASAIKKSNCNDLGVISAEAKDGTGPYTYQVVAAGTPTVATDWVTTAVFDRAGSIAGIDYDVYAKDAYGCIVNVPVTVLADAEPTIDPVTSICYDGNEFTISIAGTVDPAIVGDATYSVNGSAFQTGTDFTFNAAGTYNLVIKDGNGCTANVDYIVYPQLDLKAAITKELDCTGTPDAIITLTTTGGNTTSPANYTYQVSYNGGPTSGASETYTATLAGDYLFTVTDANNATACTTTVSISVDAIPTPTITPVVTDVSCNGGNDGTITVDVTGGIGPYTYVLTSNPANTTGDLSGIYTGLVAGTTYQVTVTDAKSCDYVSGSIIVDQPTALDASAVVTTVLQCGPANAATEAVVTVTVVAGTGTSPYEYSFDGGTNFSSDATFRTFTAGPVNAIVKDAKGCLFTVPTVTVDALDPPVITAITGTPIYCAPVANTTSTVTISHSNGIGTISYAILEPASATTNTSGATSGVFTGLAVGTYLFEVKDANGCTAQQYYTVDPVVNVTVTGQVISGVKCFGESNGVVEFTVDNYVGTYSYSVNGIPVFSGQTTPKITLTGLPAGTQQIVVTDETSLCTATFTVTVTEPAKALSLVAKSDKNANCNFGAKVSAIASDGTPGYTYAFALASDPAPAAGDYTTTNTAVLDATLGLNWIAYAKDVNGCTAQDLLTLVIDPLPTIDLLANIYCYDGNPITVTITGAGVGPLRYSIGNGYQSSPDFVLTAPKTYDFYVQDANGCIVTEKYTLNQELLLQATLTQDLTCDNNASITFLATQGSLAYTTYEVDIDGAGYTTFTGTPYIASTPGIYTFRVTDSAGCQAISQEIIVTPKTTPTFTFTQTNVKCVGGNNGVITITAADGITPYSYSINGATAQASNVFKDLTAGTYTIEVKDAKGCFPVTKDVIITQPTALAATIDVTTPLSCGAANATQPAIVTVTVDPTTGTAPYKYSFDNGFNYTDVNTFETFKAGTVSALVKDANDCTIAAAVTTTVDALDPPVITTITGTDIWCNPVANQTSTVTVTYTNGVGPLSFNIIEPTVGTPQTSNVFAGLVAGTYLFQVTDANDCTAQQYYTVDDVVNITVSGQVIKDVACVGDANGVIEFKAANFKGGFTPVLTPSPATMTMTTTGDTVTITGLIADSYTLRVTDNITNCFADATVVVKQPTALILVPVSNVNATCNTDALVTVAASGGTPVYLYAFVGAGVIPTPTDYSAVANKVLDKTITNWDVYVKDNNNCSTFINVTTATAPLPSGITISGLSQCPTATGDYTFTVDVASGVAPYEYSIGSGFQTSPTFTVTSSGDYDVTVKDANECEVTIPALVSILAPLNLQAIATTLPSCDTNNGVINATVTGGSGTGNYRFTIDGGVVQNADSFSFAGLAPGAHIVSVRDVFTNCIAEITVNLEIATPITNLTVTKTDISCNGGNNGTITATIGATSVGVNDNPVYTYEYFGTTIGGTAVSGSATPNNVFENLRAGDYTVTVRSGRGCVASKDIRLIQPAAIVVPTPVVTQFGCTAGTNGANYATITVSGVTGGSSNYVIYEFSKGTTIVQTSASNVYTEADYAGGSYTVKVYDDNNCIGSTTTVIIDQYIALDKITIDKVGITCRDLESITATAVDVAGNPVTGIEYTLADDAGVPLQAVNTTGVFNNLNVGNYIITAFNSITGCSIQAVHYVNDPKTFELQAVKTSDVICFGSNEGAVTITLIDTQVLPTDDAGAFSYTVTGPTPSSGTSATAGPLNLTNLTAGEYTFTATLVATPYCSVRTVFTIDQPVAELTLVETHTEITCITGNNDGSISVSASGGWGSEYQYEVLKDGTPFSAYSNVTDYTDLTAGVYTVNVKDSKGCVATETVTLVVPTPITATISLNANLLSCYGDTNGVVTVDSVTGGSGNYNFSLVGTLLDGTVITTAPQTATTFTNLKAGSYQVIVTDDWTCTSTSNTVVLNEPTRVTAELIVERTETCTVAPQVRLTASGGTGPYYYGTDGINFPVAFTSSVVITLPMTTTATEYQYYVKDQNGCTSFISNPIEFSPVPTLTFDKLEKVDVKCTGSATGAVYVIATGGLGNYVYTLVDPLGNAIVPTPTQLYPGEFTNLPAGDYLVRVTSLDCSYFEPISIIQPTTPLTSTTTKVDITCNGSNDGSFTAVGSGGTGQIKYAISPDLDQFFDSGIFKDLKAGIYQVIVQDENGCYIVHDFEIKQPAILYATYDPLLIIPEVCSGDRNGAFTIEIFGGTAPYKVSLDDKNGTYTQGAVGQTLFDFTNLIGGTHNVYIKDANDCETEIEVIMPDAVVLNPEAIVTYDCVNNTQANTVLVRFDDSNDPADLDFDLDGLGNWQVSNIFENLTPGTHSISVRHTNGCIQATDPFDIIQVDPLGLAIDDGDLNQIKATATGGAGDYEYSFNGEAFTKESTYAFYKTGIYPVTVRDKNGCTVTVSREFTFIDVCIPNYFTPNGDGTLDTWGPGCSNNYPDLTFDIFDRYGRAIAKYRIGDKWDGKYKGEELPSGDYWYVIKLNNNKDNREFVGHFTLYR